jgi:hypothetical protein
LMGVVFVGSAAVRARASLWSAAHSQR